MSQRQYTLKRRAEKQRRTRAHIVDATVALHEEVGPEKTTVKAIAERAGVERLTVYRHFPDDASLFQACAARFTELNPPPDPAQWRHLAGPEAMTRSALAAIYVYYRETARMFSRVHRDAEQLPALKAVLADFEAYLDGIRDEILDRWRPRGGRRRTVKAVAGHALRFTTWTSLSREGLTDQQMARLIARWIAGEAGAASR